jgi:hypothetical protein
VVKTSTVAPTVEHAALGVVIRATLIIISDDKIDLARSSDSSDSPSFLIQDVIAYLRASATAGRARSNPATSPIVQHQQIAARLHLSAAAQAMASRGFACALHGDRRRGGACAHGWIGRIFRCIRFTIIAAPRHAAILHSFTREVKIASSLSFY